MNIYNIKKEKRVVIFVVSLSFMKGKVAFEKVDFFSLHV